MSHDNNNTGRDGHNLPAEWLTQAREASARAKEDRGNPNPGPGWTRAEVIEWNTKAMTHPLRGVPYQTTGEATPVEDDQGNLVGMRPGETQEGIGYRMMTAQDLARLGLTPDDVPAVRIIRPGTAVRPAREETSRDAEALRDALDLHDRIDRFNRLLATHPSDTPGIAALRDSAARALAILDNPTSDQDLPGRIARALAILDNPTSDEP